MSKFSLINFLYTRQNFPCPDNYKSTSNYEVEVVKKLQERVLPSKFPLRGSPIPESVFNKRVLDTSNSSSLVSTVVRPDLTEINTTDILTKLGILQVTNESLTNIRVPGISTDIEAQWILEGALLDDSDMVFGENTVTPKILGASFNRSRSFFKQQTNLVETLLIDDINSVFESKIVSTVFEGSGESGQPVGILNHPNTTEIECPDVFDYDLALQMVKAAENATIKNNFFWVTNPNTKYTLSKREKAAGSDKFLIEDGKMANYPVIAFNKITEGNLFFGDYSSVLITKYFTDILLNQFMDPNKVLMLIWKYLDITLRNPSSLVYSQIN